MAIDENIWKLMSRAVFGEADDEEIQQLQDCFKQDESLQQQYDTLCRLFEKSGRRADPAVISYELQALRLLSKADKMQVEARFSTPAPKRRRVKYWIAAASIIIAVLIGSVLFNNLNKTKSETVKLASITKDGERKSITLVDGTKVWLNAGSRLVYLTDFSTGSREVELKGEAFFDVIENKAKPFIVHTGDVRIKVLGTTFNVKAYTEDKNVITSLYRGLVSVSKVGKAENLQPILLYPYQKLIIPKKTESTISPSHEVNTRPAAATIEFLDSTKQDPERVETSWIYDRLEFRGDDFVSLGYKLEHWYNVKIHFEDEQVKRLSFNGSFEQETIAQALQALQLANPFTYKIKNNEVFIYSNP